MPHRTDIEWADYSSNPLRALAGGRRGHACVKISPGCAACYSETMNNRFGTQRDYTKANIGTVEHFLDEKEMQHILTFKPRTRTGEPYYKNGSIRPRVFPFDMTDLFGDWVSDETILQVLSAFYCRQDVDWLILTKRAQRAHDIFNAAPWFAKRMRFGVGKKVGHGTLFDVTCSHRVLPNVWLGVSAENQKYADERVPLLLQTPAAVRFVSAEPLLGPIDFGKWMDPLQELLTCNKCGEEYASGEADHNGLSPCCRRQGDPQGETGGSELDLIIVGGESGSGARYCNVEDIRSIVRQCRDAGVSCFVKQLGSKPIDRTAKQGLAPGVCCDEFNVRYELKHSKGGDINEWPKSLRVRQMPGATS